MLACGQFNYWFLGDLQEDLFVLDLASVGLRALCLVGLAPLEQRVVDERLEYTEDNNSNCKSRVQAAAAARGAKQQQTTTGSVHRSIVRLCTLASL